ncbi:Molybdenum cofactor guanylyltransferase OS=Streptomyces microflavus OX=1919 GN=Smic_38710 PE=4 SV=1 [Streptomyces microflavus]
MTAYDVIVLAGGAAKRLGGADKPAVRVGGRALLDRVLAACSGAGATVVVGGRRPTSRPVTWTREVPQGGGPLAALGAGVRLTAAERVLVLSADLPFLGPTTVDALLVAAGADGREGALCTDPDGRDQPLVAVYRWSRSAVSWPFSPPSTAASPVCRSGC